jgi:hypothetical protein
VSYKSDIFGTGESRRRNDGARASMHLWLQRIEIGKGSSWWFETFILKIVKKSVKLYSFLEQRQKKKWQDRFRCADHTYKYVLDRALS